MSSNLQRIEGSRSEHRTDSLPYLDHIGRPDAREVLTPLTPMVYVSPEFGIDGLGFAGGLGILAGDHVLQLGQTDIPTTAVGLCYTHRSHAMLTTENWQYDADEKLAHPRDLGLEQVLDNIIVRANGDYVPYNVYRYPLGPHGSLNLLAEAVPDSHLGVVYQGKQDDTHRIYQLVSLGFGGYKALRALGQEPGRLHLNEASTLFMGVAMLDDYTQRYSQAGYNPADALRMALENVRNRTILTNHTLVGAARASYSGDQIGNFMQKNLQSEPVRDMIAQWVEYNGGKLPMPTLAMFLAGRYNAVSKLHGMLATQGFQGEFGQVWDGRPVDFPAVTNAIHSRWYPDYHEIYRQAGILDAHDLPTTDYQRRIDQLNPNIIWETKQEQKANLRQLLREREGINLPDNAIIAGWARRFAEYKRPDMLLANPNELKRILNENPNLHIVYSGKAHSTDDNMKWHLKQLLDRIQGDELFRQRIHYVQDYDIPTEAALTAGCNIWLNNPRVGEEACGTSGIKAAANNTLLVSTPDGFAYEMARDSFYAIEGSNFAEELQSLYNQLESAVKTVQNPQEWIYRVKKQLKAITPIMAGGRMIADYVDLAIPTAQPLNLAA